MVQRDFGAGELQAGDVAAIFFDHTGTLKQLERRVLFLAFFIFKNDETFYYFHPKPVLGATFKTYKAAYTLPESTDVSGGFTVKI